VQPGGASSSQVLVPVSVTSGIFSQNGSGYGQGYILNKDGTLNTPSNPAAPGDPITIFATGVGPVSLVQCYAVTGFPGSVYQIIVYVPNPAALAVNNPSLLNFVLAPLAGVTMQIDGASSQNGLAISISQ
jgi:uncharacterized protein (TIGR03437 family)